VRSLATSERHFDTPPSGVAAIWTFWIYPGAAEPEGVAKVGLKQYIVENSLHVKDILST